MLFKLTSPYPAPRPNQSAILTGLFMGIFVGVFLLYFKPFGLRFPLYAEAPEKILFFGAITFFCFILTEVIFPWLLPSRFKDQNWRVWHRILYYLLLLFLIATLNGLYINWLQNLTFTPGNYASIMTQTIALGMLPITMIVLFRFNQKSVFYLKQAEELRRAAHIPNAPSIVPEDAGRLEASDDFLAAEAFGNYVKVYYATGEGYRQEVQRITLASLVAEKESEGVLRCHRSFAVQPGRVHEVSGNAQGLKLSVGKGNLEVPVSRTYLPAVRSALE